MDNHPSAELFRQKTADAIAKSKPPQGHLRSESDPDVRKKDQAMWKAIGYPKGPPESEPEKMDDYLKKSMAYLMDGYKTPLFGLPLEKPVPRSNSKHPELADAFESNANGKRKLVNGESSASPASSGSSTGDHNGATARKRQRSTKSISKPSGISGDVEDDTKRETSAKSSLSHTPAHRLSREEVMAMNGSTPEYTSDSTVLTEPPEDKNLESSEPRRKKRQSKMTRETSNLSQPKDPKDQGPLPAKRRSGNRK